MADDKQYKIVEAIVIEDTTYSRKTFNVKLVDSNKILRIVNNTPFPIKDGDEVFGYIIQTNIKLNIYGFYVTDNKSSCIDSDSLINIINICVVNAINNEGLLFNQYKEYVSLEDLGTKTRRREVVTCKHIAIMLFAESVRRSVAERKIEEVYNIDRSTMYASIKKMNNCKDKQILMLVDNIRKELSSILNNNNEQEIKEELFPFLDNY